MNEYSLPKQFPVTCHTSFVGKGSTFVAIKGQQYDGVDFIPQAIDLGAVTIVIQQDVILSREIQNKIKDAQIVVERVENPRLVLSILSAAALGHPAHRLKIIGITGTKGKTTTSYIVEHILRTAGYKTALISTVANKIGNCFLSKNLTTPQPDYLHMFFAECVKQGIQWVVMEVSAQALSLHRVHGIAFDGVIFTNFSQEHAEFYTSQQAYFQAKCLLFSQLKDGAPCIINADDAWFSQMSEYIKKIDNCLPISLQNYDVAIQGTIVKNSFYNGLSVAVSDKKNIYMISSSSVVGTFNAYNAVMAASLTSALKIATSTIQKAIKSFEGVPGRMQRHILSNGALALIDYAHTPSSFESVLVTIHQTTHHLIVIFGAGGNRDKTKRPEMGKIAALYADIIILTTDNPRDEDPQDIVDDIVSGIDLPLRNKVIRELDRKCAIEKAYALSDSKSIIVLLGKGPDEYQEIRGIKIPFSERDILFSL